MKTRKILALITAAAMVSAISLPVYAQDGEDLKKITFCLDWTPNTNHTGLYAAQALGYYEEAGLDVEIVQPPESSSALMCAAGQAQFAIEAQDTMAASLDLDEPLGITAVAGILQHNTSGILSRSGDGITSPKGLEGKTYSTWESPIELAMIQYVMEQDGGDFDQVTLIPNDITDEPAALAAHQTDAIWVFYGWGGINAEVEDVAVDYWNFSDISQELDYYTPVIIANNAFLEEDPDTAKAFMEATAKGYAFAAENPIEAADMLIAGDSTGSLAGTEDLVYASQEWISQQYIADADSWGTIDPARWDNFYKWLSDHALTAHDLTGIGYTNDYLPQ
ncbi:MAG: ABC transporter substrate-binding protein [Blautia sp.]|nr:ABC transporter substrate-binding protein [Blautia sp.]